MATTTILDVVWFSPLQQHCIGIVKVDTGYGIKWYIGVGDGENEALDAQKIVQRGARFHPGLLQRFFDAPKEAP